MVGVRCKLHQLLFKPAADSVVVADDGANEEVTGNGKEYRANGVDSRSDGGVAAGLGAVCVAVARRDETSTELADILPDRAMRLDRSVEKVR